MGSLYRPTYRATDGTLKESAIVWLKYRDALGILRRESSETTKEQEARRALKQREGAAVEGRVILPRADRVTIAELAETLKADYKANGRRSADRLAFSLAHVLPFFGARRAIQSPAPTSRSTARSGLRRRRRRRRSIASSPRSSGCSRSA
jgi:hypothetical protein